VSGGDRYARQAILPEIGEAGQERLRRARLLFVGAGGLGSAALPYLAGAGVGRITIIDPDRVDRTNLHRQILYGERDVGRPKATAAADRLRDLNPDIEIVAIEGSVEPSNVAALLRDHDVVVDGCDTFAAKYLLADTTARLRMPLVYGSVTGMEAMVTVFDVRHGPCLRCLFPQPPEGFVPNCAQAGVLGPLVGITGAMQGAEAVKLLVVGSGAGSDERDGLRPLIGRLWHLDARDMRSRTVAVAKRAGCAGCAGTAKPVAWDAGHCAAVAAVDAATAAELPGALFVDVRERHEFAAGHIAGALNRPLSALRAAPASLPGAPSYVVYCSHGVRSVTASHLLTAAGFGGVHHLAGGLTGWSAPLEHGQPATTRAPG
jgi:sulfur-carrier protein adenylyltransferase/sulfurtransferase